MPSSSATSILLPDGTRCLGFGVMETRFLHHEIFVRKVYAAHGIELADGDTVVDVGAHIGMFVRFLAGFGKKLTVHAFEPVPQIFAALVENVRGLPIDVRLHPLGVGRSVVEAADFAFFPLMSCASTRHAREKQAERGPLTDIMRWNLLSEINGIPGAVGCEILATLGKSASDLVGLEPGHPEFEALVADYIDRLFSSVPAVGRVTTLSNVIAEDGIESIALLEIDVEGDELDVLLGIADDDWPKIRQLVMEIHDVGERVAETLALLERHGLHAVVDRDPSAPEALNNRTLYAKRRAG